jgi:hypothetical protein
MGLEWELAVADDFLGHDSGSLLLEIYWEDYRVCFVKSDRKQSGSPQLVRDPSFYICESS